MTLTVGSLCSGFGGLDLGLERAGWEVAWHVEPDAACSTVLEAHWPGVPNLGDIKTADWKELDHMAAHRNDALAYEMYDDYCQGLSVEQVARKHGRSRQTVWKMFQRRGLDLRPRPPARPSVDFGGRLFTLRDGGYYAATDGSREYLHRAVWVAAHGPIPVGHDVHHRDHDKTNNDPTNLECLPKDVHAALHGTGCNQHLHRCDQGVMPHEDPAVDLIAGGYP